MVTVSCRNINHYNIGVLTIPYQYHIDIGKNFIVSAKYSVRSFGARVHGIQRSVIDPGQSIDTYVDSLRGKMGLVVTSVLRLLHSDGCFRWQDMVCMDANLGVRTFNTLQRMRGGLYIYTGIASRVHPVRNSLLLPLTTG
uniref:Uncharacterized protein n=1 Tax=Rhizophagus irregularis (strain DAOM 181602 / DAOM 197198 / MUCL 43194) TaxID=747089 RepID=U9TXG2_RHIID